MHEGRSGGEQFLSSREKRLYSEQAFRTWVENPENYARFVVRCQQILFKLNIFDNKMSAQDLAHETVQHALENIDKFTYESDVKLQAWMTTMALNRARNSRSALNRHQMAAEKNYEGESLYAASRFIQADEVEAGEEISREKWLEAMNNLSPERREVLELHLRNYSNVDIAKELNIPPNTVGTRLFRALKDLKSYLDAQHPQTNKEQDQSKNTPK